MDPIPISLQLMDPNCKPIHARAYTVPRSVEQSKEIVRLVDIGVLEEDYSSEWASYFPSFGIPKKKRTKSVVTFKMSCLSLSKIWNILRPAFYLDDLLILTNSSFKYHLLQLEMVLARLSTAGMRVNMLISPNLSSLQNK
jgi:hypothetical protein